MAFISWWCDIPSRSWIMDLTLLMLSPAWTLTVKVLPVRDLTKNCIFETSESIRTWMDVRSLMLIWMIDPWWRGSWRDLLPKRVDSMVECELSKFYGIGNSNAMVLSDPNDDNWSSMESKVLDDNGELRCNSGWSCTFSSSMLISSLFLGVNLETGSWSQMLNCFGFHFDVQYLRGKEREGCNEFGSGPVRNRFVRREGKKKIGRRHRRY